MLAREEAETTQNLKGGDEGGAGSGGGNRHTGNHDPQDDQCEGGSRCGSRAEGGRKRKDSKSQTSHKVQG